MEFLYYIVAYLVGSLSAAIIICRALRLPDPRAFGSKNAGAANVSRQGGKLVGLLVLVLDAIKGMLITAAVQIDPLNAKPSLIFASIAVLAGHMYPIFFKFRGGKGVATALGIVAAVSPIAAVCAFVSYALVLFVSKISSISIFSSILVVYGVEWLRNGIDQNFLLFIVLTCAVFYGLRDNIVRLILRREHSVP